MVAVRFDGLEGSCAFEDCYISVRVGNVQKLSRLSGARRVYQFPEPPEGQKYGRVEIFRRIGSGCIDLSPEAEPRQVHLSCQEPELAEVSMQVTVEEDSPKGPPSATEQQSKRLARRQAATDYLGKHSIESQLSSVMRAVLQEMPENPKAFLAARLLGEPATDGRLRLGPVSARIESPGQDRTMPMPRSPAEPSLQRGKKPYNGARKLAPLDAPKAGKMPAPDAPSLGQGLEVQREPDLDFHDVLDLEEYAEADAEGAAQGAKPLLGSGGLGGQSGAAGQASFTAYYRAHMVGSRVAEGTARSLFPPRQDAKGVIAESAQGAAADDASLAPGAGNGLLVPTSALYGAGFPGLGVAYSFNMI